MPIEIDRRDLYRWIATALLVLVSLVAIVGGGWALVRGRSPGDRPRRCEGGVGSPPRAGLSRPFAVVAALRRQYIVPALRATDDASALAALGARADFVRYLRRADPAACRQFALGNLLR